ncbi:MAG TPA: hypothetical protein VMU95_33290 [Trebonia sp.]|nr:hypothetical protein [Trebonia sp.]
MAGATAALLVIAIAACGSTSSQASTSAVSGSALTRDCTAVADVLADGPDPDADSVGYAEAQVLPLRQLKLSDTALSRDVQALAQAYQSFSSGSGAGSHAAAAAVTKAESSVNSICPQAAP